MILRIFAAACFAAIAAYDITNTELFEPLRNRSKKSPCKLARAVQCHYCFSHYTSALCVALFAVRVGWDGPVGYVAGWAVTLILSQPIMLALDWSIDAMNGLYRLFDDKRSSGTLAESSPFPELEHEEAR